MATDRDAQLDKALAMEGQQRTLAILRLYWRCIDQMDKVRAGTIDRNEWERFFGRLIREGFAA